MTFAIATEKDIRFAVEASMETGNPSRAAIILREYAEYYPVTARTIRQEVLDTYRIDLEK